MGIGATELIVIFAILLLLFGASRLEGLGSSFGKAIKSFKKGLNDPVEDESKKEKEKEEKK
jgi:sec-independent protein translocase protein TatA